jgi:hypothetical protein
MAKPEHFTMSAFIAVLAIRRYIERYPSIDAATAAYSIRETDVDYESSDFVSGLELHEYLSSEIRFIDPVIGFRSVIATLVARDNPLWVRLAPSGRARVRAALTRNEDQCFRAAGLFEEPPSSGVVAWWDWLAQSARAAANDRLLLQGREAERWSLAHERARLARLGIEREPKWLSIEDNSVGYDIRSYDRGSIEPISRLIEVKSSTQTPLRIILSRSEWDTAVRYGEAFYFHIWDFPTATLYERTVADLWPHIPIDQGAGDWMHVEIGIEEVESR